MPSPRAFIINVGANAASLTLRSPIFDDGSFIFVPIEHDDLRQEASPGIARYRDVLPDALPYIPERFHDAGVHSDPEFTTFTYGDWPEDRGRPALLKQIAAGDHLLFLARLVHCQGEPPDISWREPGFYIVGFLVVAEVVRRVTRQTSKSVLRRIGRNAHVGLMYAGLETEGFWVFRGGPGSALLGTAMPFDRDLADRAMRDRDGRPYVWGGGKSDLQVIGSYTRSCRMIDDPARVAVLLGELAKHVG